MLQDSSAVRPTNGLYLYLFYNNKSRDLTASYLLKQQSRSKSFPNAPHAYGTALAYTNFCCNAQPIQPW